MLSFYSVSCFVRCWCCLLLRYPHPNPILRPSFPSTPHILRCSHDHTLSWVPIPGSFHVPYLYDLLRTDDHPYSILHIAFALRVACIFLPALSFVLDTDILSSLQIDSPLSVPIMGLSISFTVNVLPFVDGLLISSRKDGEACLFASIFNEPFFLYSCLFLSLVLRLGLHC